MKRLIALILVIIVTLSFVPVYAQDTKSESNETQFLKTVGVLEAGFSENSKITKGEFTKRIVNLLYPDVDFSALNAEGAFNDVNESTKDASYIKAAKDLGIVNGNTSNMFYADSNISSVDAVVIACNALGYSIYAKELGGYPTGYMTVASNNQLTKGLSYMDEIDGLYMAKLLYNVLFLFPAKIESISVDGITISENRINVLETVYNIKKYDAILWDNGVSSVDGVSLGDEERCVFLISSDNTYISAYTGSTDISGHLGSRMNVYIFYDELKGRSEIIKYTIHSVSEEYMINADRIIKFDENGIEFEKEGNSGKTEKISFKNSLPPVLLNGVIYAGYDINALIPDDGFIRVPVNGGDIPLVEIISFNIYANGVKGKARNIVADTLDMEEGYINCRLSPENSLKFEENDTLRYISVGENNLSYLKEGAIVSVAQSYEKVNGGYLYLLAVCNDKVNGAVTGTSVADKKITVGNEELEVSDSILKVKSGFISNIKFNEDAVFYLDSTGKIAYSSSNIRAIKNYAYILASAVRTSADKTLYIKLLDKEGIVDEYIAADKIKINNTDYTDMDRAYTALTKCAAGSSYTQSIKKPVIVTFNSAGKIREIDTDTPNISGSTDINIYSTHSHIKYSNEEISDNNALKAGYRSPRANIVNKGKSYSIDGRFYMNSDTVIFSVPEIDMYGLDVWTDYASNQYGYYKKTPVEKIVKEYEGSIEDKYYRLYDLASFDDRKCYDIQGYDIDPDTGYAGLVVLRGRNDVYWYGKVPYTSGYPMAVFLNKAEAYDEEFDRMVTKVYYTTDGKNKLSATIDTENTLKIYKYLLDGSTASENGFGINVPALKKGDIVRIITQDGRISHIERVVKADNLFKAFSSIGYPYVEPNPYTNVFPFDERTSYNSISGNYVVAAGYVRSQSQGNLNVMLGKNTVDSVDTSAPLTYTEQIYNVAAVKPIVITVSVDKNDYNKVKEITKVEQGDYTDIVTTSETGGNTDKASLVIIKSTNYNVETVFIINREGI